MTYTQNLWTVREARFMIQDWIAATKLTVPGSMEIEVLNTARVNQWRLADCGWDANFHAPQHKLRFWLPKIVLCANRRNLDAVELFKDTALHEFAHLKHSQEIIETVFSELNRRDLDNGSFWTVWREMTKGRAYHSGHGDAWRKWCIRTGAAPRATVETQLRSLGASVQTVPLAEAMTNIQGYPLPKTNRTLAKSATSARKVTPARANRAGIQAAVAMKTACSECFTIHGEGQRGCW